MSEESTTTIKSGSEYDAWWDVTKGTVEQRKAQVIEASGLLPDHYKDKTLYQVASAASLVAQAEFKGARQAASKGFRPPTISDPGANEATVQEPEYTGLAAFVVAAKSEKELYDLHDKNKNNWTPELNELATKRKAELATEGSA